MKELKIGCGRPTGANIGEKPSKTEELSQPTRAGMQSANLMMARVGAKAPDFEAPAFYKGNFGQIKLSDYLERWGKSGKSGSRRRSDDSGAFQPS